MQVIEADAKRLIKSQVIPTYNVIGTLKKENIRFNAKLDFAGKTNLYMLSSNEFKKYIINLTGKQGEITEIKHIKLKLYAPLLYNLADIQFECKKIFNLNFEQTTKILEELYNNKLITNPITSSRKISKSKTKDIDIIITKLFEEFKDNEIKPFIEKIIIENYLTKSLNSKYIDDDENTNINGIIPTADGIKYYNRLGSLHKEIYKLIVKRFISLFYPYATFNRIIVTVKIENETFIAKEVKMINAGYLEIYGKKYENKFGEFDKLKEKDKVYIEKMCIE